MNEFGNLLFLVLILKKMCEIPKFWNLEGHLQMPVTWKTIVKIAWNSQGNNQISCFVRGDMEILHSYECDMWIIYVVRLLPALQ